METRYSELKDEVGRQKEYSTQLEKEINDHQHGKFHGLLFLRADKLC